MAKKKASTDDKKQSLLQRAYNFIVPTPVKDFVGLGADTAGATGDYINYQTAGDFEGKKNAAESFAERKARLDEGFKKFGFDSTKQGNQFDPGQYAKRTSEAAAGAAPFFMSAPAKGAALTERAITGGITGGMIGFSESDAPLFSVDRVKDTATGALGGIAGGEIAHRTGKVLQEGTRKVAGGMYNKIFQEPTKKATRVAIKQGQQLGEQVLETGTPAGKGLTPSSIYKNAMSEEFKLEKQLDDILQKAKGFVSVEDINKAVDPLVERYARSGNKTAANGIRERIGNIFEMAENGRIPIATANQIKRDLYNEIKDSAYGELSTAQKEGMKAIARGFRSGIEKADPAISGINKGLRIAGRIQDSVLEKLTKDERQRFLNLRNIAAAGIGYAGAGPLGVAAPFVMQGVENAGTAIKKGTGQVLKGVSEISKKAGDLPGVAATLERGAQIIGGKLTESLGNGQDDNTEETPLQKDLHDTIIDPAGDVSQDDFLQKEMNDLGAGDSIDQEALDANIQGNSGKPKAIVAAAPNAPTMQAKFEVTQAFGQPSPYDVFSGGVNYGTDIATPPGTPVKLPQGRWDIVEAFNGATDGYIGDGTNRGYGNSILARNADTGELLRISHLSQVNVAPGQQIEGGVVGATGASGNVTGPHADVEYYDTSGQIADVLQSPYKDLFDRSGRTLAEVPPEEMIQKKPTPQTPAGVGGPQFSQPTAPKPGPAIVAQPGPTATLASAAPPPTAAANPNEVVTITDSLTNEKIPVKRSDLSKYGLPMDYIPGSRKPAGTGASPSPLAGATKEQMLAEIERQLTEVGGAEGRSNATAIKSLMDAKYPKEKEKNPVKYSEGQMKELTDYLRAYRELKGLQTLVEKNSDVFGPISGRIGENNPYNTKAQAVNAEIARVRQIVGKALEGGVLRKEDEDKYKKILANLSDKPEVAMSKIKSLLNTVKKDYLNKKQKYGSPEVSKYSTPVFQTGEVAVGEDQTL